MILLATHREIRPGTFRSVIRLDDVCFDLAGTYSRRQEAQEAADAMLTRIRSEARRTIRRISTSCAITRGGQANLSPPLR